MTPHMIDGLRVYTTDGCAQHACLDVRVKLATLYHEHDDPRSADKRFAPTHCKLLGRWDPLAVLAEIAARPYLLVAPTAPTVPDNADARLRWVALPLQRRGESDG